MSVYVAVDPGKYNTKVVSFNTDTNEYKKTKFRTKISEGSFDDDMIPNGSFVVRVDGGPVYMVGAGARLVANLETDKKTEIHKVCTLTAIGMMLANNEDKVNCCVGIPFAIGNIVKERLAYKDFMIPEGEHTVELKMSGNAPIKKVTFNFGKRYVYAESTGVVYEYPSKLDEISGVVDIGNLNKNCTYCASHEIQADRSFTDNQGGESMITGLAQELSAKLNSSVDINLTASVLLKPKKDRFIKKPAEIVEQSRQIIDDYLLEYAHDVKRKLEAKQWPVAHMNLCMIGGTVKLIANELLEVFGDIFIPEEPEFVNVAGFLRKLCADDDIDVEAEKKKGKK